MDRNRWLLFGGICVAIIAGLVYTSSKDKVSVDNVNPFAITTNSVINDRVFGNKDAKVTLWEYGDFQCPGCGAAHANLKSISEKYKNSMRFVFRNFPLTSAHPHAFAAAATAEAAGQQNKYWEMYDKLYETRESWSSMSAEQRQSAFEQYAKEIALDMDKFKADIASKPVADKINFDRALGLKLGVDSTPTLYLDTTKVSSDITSNVMQGDGKKLTDAIDKAIKDAGGTPPSQ